MFFEYLGSEILFTKPSGYLSHCVLFQLQCSRKAMTRDTNSRKGCGCKWRVKVIVLNATFNNISVMAWRSA